MKKTETISLRIGREDRERFQKAARDYKNISSFIRKTCLNALRFEKIIKQAEKLGLKTSAMKVVEG